MSTELNGTELEWYATPETSEERKRAFESAFGWRYGLVFGLVLLFTCWGQDAWVLVTSSAELGWGKLLLAAITVLPLLVLAGWLAGRAYSSNPTKLVLWIITSGASGWIAVHLPFQGMSWLTSMFDSTVQGVTVFPFVEDATFMVVIAIVVGVVIAIPAALVQVLATQWAWDRSTEQGQITITSTLFLFLALPLALLLGLFWDGTANYNLRAPIQRSGLVFQMALSTPSDLDMTKMPQDEMMTYVAGLPWRGRISSHYTQYIAYYDPETMQQATVDIAFDNGLILRCQLVQFGRFMGGCFDLGDEAAVLVSQFIQTGKTPCKDCSVQIGQQAAAWRAKLRSDSVLVQIQVTHHAGSVLLVQGQLGSEGRVQCRLVGAQPVVIHDCSGP